MEEGAGLRAAQGRGSGSENLELVACDTRAHEGILVQEGFSSMAIECTPDDDAAVGRVLAAGHEERAASVSAFKPGPMRHAPRVNLVEGRQVPRGRHEEPFRPCFRK